MSIIDNVKFRVFGNLKTTLGGGTVLGVVFAALISKLEDMSGCRFREAFAGLDWGQLTGFLVVQMFGAFVTDGNKKVDDLPEDVHVA